MKEKLENQKNAKLLRSTPWIKLLSPPPYSTKPACIRTLFGHVHRVTSVAITPDGSWAVSADDYELRVWNLMTGECKWVLEGAKGVAISADGQCAASGAYPLDSSRHSVKVWDLKTGQCRKELKGHIDDVTTISMTPDGRLAVSGSNGSLGSDKCFRVWDLIKEECIYVSEEHKGRIRRVIISPDGHYVIVEPERFPTCVWDLVQHRMLYQIFGGADRFAITIDSKKLIFVKINDIDIVNLSNGELMASIKHQHKTLSDIAITPDGRYAATSSWIDCKLSIWDLNLGKCIKTFGQQDLKPLLSIAITPDCHFAVTGEIGGIVRMWDLSAQPTAIPEKHIFDIQDVCIIPKESIVLTGAGDSESNYNMADPEIRVWDLNTQKCIRVYEDNEAGWRGLFINPNGRQFISGHNQSLKLWNLDGNLIKKLDTDPNIGGAYRYKIKFSPDGNRAIYDYWDTKQGKLVIWDLLSGDPKEIRDGQHENTILGLEIFANGRNAITCSIDKTLRLWDLENLTCIGKLQGAESQIVSVSVAPDNYTCITREANGSVILWDLSVMKIIDKLPSYGRTDQAEFLLDGRSVIINGVTMGSGTIVYSLRQKKSNHLKGFSLTGVPSCDNWYVFGRDSSGMKIHDLEKNSNVINLGFSAIGFAFQGVNLPRIVLGSRSGYISFYSVENFPLGPAVVSPVRLWIFSPLGRKGHWDEHITAFCPWCQQRFNTPKKVLGTIEGINRNSKLTQDQSPCLNLPDEVWDDPGLLSDCPKCGKKLKFNPFIAGNDQLKPKWKF